MNRHVKTVLAMVVIALMAFWGGITWSSRTSARAHRMSAAYAGGLMVRAGQGDSSSGGNDSPDLRPWEMLYEVVSNLKRHYVRDNIDERELTYGAVRGMLKSLNDKYTRFLTPEEYHEFQIKNEGQFYGIGAQIYSEKDPKTGEEMLVVVPLDESPAQKAGLKAGDWIIKIDGKSARNMPVQSAVAMIRGERGSKVLLTILRKPTEADGQPVQKDVTIVRDLIQIPAVEWKMLDGGIGVIRLNDFNEKADRELEKAFTSLKEKGLNGLVFDLRENPGGLLEVAISVASRFVKTGTIVRTEGRAGNEDHQAQSDRYWDLKGPLVVLVDKYSASGSEIVAGAVQDRKAGKIVGEATYGKGSVQLLVRLKNGGALAITTARYLTPNGHDINEIGVKPDVVVEQPKDAVPDASGEHDTQLQKAAEILKDTIAARKDSGSTKAARR